MARTVRNAKIDSRSARAKLKARREPYWTVVTRGAAIGYRRGVQRGSWIARSRDRAGKQHYQALGAADDAVDADGDRVLTFAQAQGKAREWFKKCGEEDAGENSHGPYTVADAAADYLDWFAANRKSFDATKYVVNSHILPALGNSEVAKLTAPKLREWHGSLAAGSARLRTRKGKDQQYRDVSDDPEIKRARKASANRILTVLKALLNHAFQNDRVASDIAWRKVKPFRGADAARLRYLEEAEAVRLLNACTPDFRRLVRGALVSGFRYGELGRLEVGDFNPGAGTLQVRQAKSGKPRHVPLDDEGVEFFEAVAAGRPKAERMFLRTNGEPWGKSHQGRPLVDACKAAKISPPISFHSLRHTWASLRVMRGMPLMVVAQVLGHSDTRMVEKHYGHLAPSYIRDAVRSTALRLGPHGEKGVEPLRPAG